MWTLTCPPDSRAMLRQFYVDMLGEDCVANVGTSPSQEQAGGG